MTFYEVGQSTIRAQFFDRIVKGFADANYKFKQALTISPSSAWKNFFFRGSTGVLAGASGNLTKGIPRGAEFPQASISWEKVQANIEKYGLEENIPIEDLLSSEVDVKERTLMKIAEGVTKSVDDAIWVVLSDDVATNKWCIDGNPTPTNILAVNNYLTASGYGTEWDTKSAAIIDNLLEAKQKISEYNYDVSDLMCFVSPKDYRSIMNYLAEKGAQFPTIGTEVATNGKHGRVAGVQLIVSNSVTASYALVVVPKRCGTWKELVPLSTTTKEDAYKSLTIRSVEFGVTELTDPKTVCIITGTQS